MIPTVTIKTPAGDTLINVSDYDPNRHKLAEKQLEDFVPPAPVTDTAPLALYDPQTGEWIGEGEPPARPAAIEPPAPPAAVTPPAPPVTPPAPPAPPAPVEKVEAFVTKHNKKWHLADKDGKRINDIDYDTDAAAADALTEYNK